MIDNAFLAYIRRTKDQRPLEIGDRIMYSKEAKLDIFGLKIGPDTPKNMVVLYLDGRQEV